MRFNKKKKNEIFWPASKIKTSEISESFLFLQFLVVYESQDPKTKKKV